MKKKQSTRLKNKVSALDKEIMKLNQTIQNLILFMDMNIIKC